jgi:hypothetical protein
MDAGNQQKPIEIWYAAVFCIVAAVCLLLRLHNLSVPLERDEGEYAYAGQLMLSGIPPFKEACNMKMPGIYGIYAAIMALFGQSIQAIHLGLIIVNLLVSAGVFLLGRRLFSPLVGCAAGACYATSSLSISVLGPFAHAEQFVVLPVVYGAWLFLRAVDSKKAVSLFFSGLLLGSGFIIKQHAASFMVFGLLMLVYVQWMSRVSWKLGNFMLPSAALVGGMMVPFAAVCGIMAGAGVFGQFWFWTVVYAREYISQVSFANGMRMLMDTLSSLVVAAPTVWGAAIVGLLALGSRARDSLQSVFAMLFFLCSFLCVCPGLYFREHYFIQMLPALALLAGIGVEAICRPAIRRMGPAACTIVGSTVAMAIALYPVVAEWHYLARLSPEKLSRAVYGANPFPESVVLARYIREHTGPADRIAVVGSEPQIYFYSHRKSATSFMYTYALMESHPFALDMQHRMIREIEAAAPAYLVYVAVSTSWLAKPNSHRLIFDWFDGYFKSKYAIDGVADIISRDTTVYAWADAARAYQPRSPFFVALFKRKQ